MPPHFFALLLVMLVGHAAAQEQPSVPAPASAAQLVAASALGACFERPPAYPPKALRNEEQGRSVLAFTVTPAGMVQDAGLLQSSGHRLLDEAAVAHLGKCIASLTPSDARPPSGRYVLPMEWRIE